jgi:carbonic anhydrase
VADNTLKMEDFSEYLESLKCNPSNKNPEVLLLTCIDYRFFIKIAKHMEDSKLSGKYDHVILAGAALGALVDFPPSPRLHWQQFFLEHLDLAIALHKIKRVIVLSHRQCGAYREFGVLPRKPTPKQEYEAHKAQANKLEQLIKQFHPKLIVDKFLLPLEDKPAEPLKLERLA